MLKNAFNSLLSIHSREATLKRFGEPDLYSPCTVSPSNYFRFLKGPEYTTVQGVEFVIPIDSMKGQFAQTLTFDKVPDSGEFSISILEYPLAQDIELEHDSTAEEIQTALRDVEGLENLVVTGNFTDGFQLLFAGVQKASTLIEMYMTTLQSGGEDVEMTATRINIPWDIPLQKGDRILDGKRTRAVDEIIEMHDLGAQIMGYRVRCE